MAMDKNDLERLLRKVPEVKPIDLPEYEIRFAHVTEQIDQFKKVLYRTMCDLEVAKNYASKDDPDAVQVAEQKILKIVSEIKGIKWTLQSLRHVMADLEAERLAAKAENSKK